MSMNIDLKLLLMKYSTRTYLNELIDGLLTYGITKTMVGEEVVN